MVRRYDDMIDVQLRDVPIQDGPVVAQPTAFVWRDRLYVVRAVQTRWYERRAWWRDAAAAALLGLRGEPQDGVTTEVADEPALDGENEVWRVEAAAGRCSPVGVFDLTRAVPATTGAGTGWRLTRVAD